MVNKRKSHDSVKCDTSQEKEAFKRAYHIIKTIYRPAFQLDSNQYDDFNHAIEELLDQMQFKYADPLKAALSSFEAREKTYRASTKLEHRLNKRASDCQEELSA